METPDAAPYAGLTPDAVLDAIECTGLRPDGRLQSLNSFENRVYQFGIEDSPPMVAKFYRPGRWSDAQILEEHAFVLELAERELPVVAPLALANGHTLHTVGDPQGGYRIAVYPRCAGRAPELEQPDTLEWMGRFLGRIHAVGALRPFVERPALDVETFGYEPRDFLLENNFIPGDLRPAWCSVVDHALENVEQCFERAGEVNVLRLHGDCHGGNVLWIESRGQADTPGGPHFVDFDDARTGPAIQDLWMLLSGDRETMRLQFNHVLRGYEDFAEFDDRERHLVEALRTLRLIHYSAWIGRRWGDPAFPAAFPWFNTPRYWQDRILELREQISLMDEAPL